jgi:hypothetical protein
MRDYNKMINTVKAIQDTFGSAEFTRKDYEKKVAQTYPISSNCYDTGTALDLRHYVVKKTREEDYVYTDKKDGRKCVGTRWYYEVNREFLADLCRMLKSDVKEITESIEKTNRKIEKLESDIEYKQGVIKMLESLDGICE